MEVSGCARKTVNKDIQALPSIQVYIDSGGRVWHDLDYVFQFLAPLQVVKRKDNFYRDCANYWRRAQLPDGHRLLRTAEMRNTSAANCCSTYALYIIILGAIAIGRIGEDSSTKLLSILGYICTRVAEVISRCPCTNAGQSPFIGFPNLRMGIEGRSVAGVWPTIQALPQQSQACLKNAWRRIYGANKVAYASLEEDWLLLRDLVIFLGLCGRSAYSPRKMPPEAEAFVIGLSSAILWWLAQLFDVYLKEVYLVAYGGDESPPAATRGRNSETRKYVMMHAEAVWDVLQEARRSGASLSTVLNIRQKDAHAGTDKTNDRTYQTKHHMMYNIRRDFAFRDARHICVISDPSIHSKKDLGVTVFWSWETGTAAFGDVQDIVQQKHLLPEDRDLPSNVVLRWDKPRRERVASYREMQALSHTISHLTTKGHGVKSISDFILPQDVILRPVKAGEQRAVIPNGDGTARAFFSCDGEDGVLTNTPVLPSSFASTQETMPRQIVLGLDQGSKGAAGCAFGILGLGLNAHVRWDKYHRLVRDLKLSLEHCCGGLFLKTQLYTSYIWSVNYKPLPALGNYGNVKKNILHAFLSPARRMILSPRFRKYGPLIASTYNQQPPAGSASIGRPCSNAGDQLDRALREQQRLSFETIADQQQVFDNMPSIAQSFVKVLSMSKLGRWFSWQQCAHEQLQEFFASKMLLEDHVEDTDPDETDAATSFDATAPETAGGKKTSQWASFNKLKVAGGRGCLCVWGGLQGPHRGSYRAL